MSHGLIAYDAAGNVTLSPEDQTFRYIGAYTYAPSTTAEVFVSIPGISAATHFVAGGAPNYGFPVVETDGVRIHPGFFSAASSTLHLFRL